ncbi:MAG: FAD-dependent oxidoreductase [Pseudomonadota bacterium]
MKIAVLGGGGAGCAIALELAAAGHQSVVFESRDEILRGATSVNEGKIHQGFIYAKDDPQSTAQIMARGAVSFRKHLSRWIDADAAIQRSTPFIYAIHRDTQLSVARLKAHYQSCCAIFNTVRAAQNGDYLGCQSPAHFEELSAAEVSELVDPEHFLALIRTSELGVDPRPIARALRDAVRTSAAIEVRTQARVTGVVTDPRGRYRLQFKEGANDGDGPFDHVVNATWESRLAIDASMGIAAPPAYSIRHKYGHRVQIELSPEDLPSLTTVLGPFGDVVNYGPNGLFLSWYPTGMTSMVSNAPMRDDWYKIDRDSGLKNFEESSAMWRRLCPPLRALGFERDDIDPASGLIYAVGDTDIDDLASGLHLRNDVGVQSVGGYHTVNTGKYTLFPMLAVTAAERIVGRRTKSKSAA